MIEKTRRIRMKTRLTRFVRALCRPTSRPIIGVLLVSLVLLLAVSAAPTQTTTLRFAVIGSYGSADAHESDVANLVKSWNPDFIITTGDNNLPDGSAATIDPAIGQYYHDFIYHVSIAFFQSQEFQESGSFVYKLYQGALGRQLTYGEFSTDRQQVIGGPSLDASKAAFADAFVQRAEFAQKYRANTTADSFVD